MYEKLKTIGVHILASLSIDIDEIQYVVTTSLFIKAQSC